MRRIRAIPGISPQVEAAPQKTAPEDRNNQASEDIAP